MASKKSTHAELKTVVRIPRAWRPVKVARGRRASPLPNSRNDDIRRVFAPDFEATEIFRAMSRGRAARLAFAREMRV